MKIADRVYGVFEIEEKVLLELLKSPPLLRLKNISQFGLPDKYYSFFNVRGYSRFEHSVGVMVLLRKLGASLEEQVAGLLHDVSHFPFSHVADWVFADGKKGNEDFHHSLTEEFVKDGKVSEILSKYSFSDKRIFEEKNFSLLEKDAPDLCADRIDYSIRQLKHWFRPNVVKPSIEGFTNYNGEIIFSNKQAAKMFSKSFLDLQTKFWGGYESVKRYHLFSKALKIAMEEGLLQRKDFFEDEKHILKILENSKIKAINQILAILNNKRLKKELKENGEKAFKKFRFVDPKVLVKGNLLRLSELDSRFKKLIEDRRAINNKGIIV